MSQRAKEIVFSLVLYVLILVALGSIATWFLTHP